MKPFDSKYTERDILALTEKEFIERGQIFCSSPKGKVPPRFELGSLDSESRVLTITPWDRLERGECFQLRLVPLRLSDKNMVLRQTISKCAQL